ncbi:MAG: hypothetical protein KatS3mg132_622 [Limisphaera sp.]|nr:MAG: hypothetical protein KatS3mg132_622 [Limisphaera sp.]
MALQADGRIWISGSFTNVNGQSRAGIARLLPDGRLDESVVPPPGMGGGGLTLLPDGSLMVDANSGRFRLLNNMPALRSLEVQPDRIVLSTSGGCPAFHDVQFSWSSNLTDWVVLGWGQPATNGWVWFGAQPPTNGWIRARGRVTCGMGNASYYWAEVLLGSPIVNADTNSVELLAGQPGSWSVHGRATAETRVQWWKDGVLVSDDMLSVAGPAIEYRVDAAGAADEGSWVVVLSNAWGMATSGPVNVRVLDPVIREPGSLTQLVFVGSSFEISPEIYASQPAEYLWFKDGVLLPDQTNATLVLPSVSLNDGGWYSVVVRNARGAATGTVARVVPTTLRLDPALPVIPRCSQSRLRLGAGFRGLVAHGGTVASAPAQRIG